MANNLTVTYRVPNLGAFAEHLREQAKEMRERAAAQRTKAREREEVTRAFAFEDVARMLDNVIIDPK
jgi:hypothetical protein